MFRFAALTFALAGTAAAAPPNVVIVMADDLGYGDLGCTGSPTIRTPHLDRMAAEGLRFTDFYAGAEVCTPSRAALLTGRLPVRSGMASDARRVLFPDSAGGLPPSEVTLAELLKTKGYATGCFGKWHLGHRPPFLPTAQGFDAYFGVPYSNDMDRVPGAPAGAASSLEPRVADFDVPLMRDAEVVERPADQTTLTRRYTDEAIAFIERNKAKPFFVYLPHTFPHVPLFRSKEMAGVSRRGLYGDVVEELDRETGRLLDFLRAEKLAENTLVFFTSDNGPWLTQKLAGGSAGPLREGKGSTWEGGMRVPCLAWWPGTIKPGVTGELASAMDLMPTCAKLAGARLPADRVIDGIDLTGLLLRGGKGRDVLFYYRGTELYAARKGVFKANYVTRPGYGREPAVRHDPPLLFDLGRDPGEHFDIAKTNTEALAAVAAAVERHKANLVRGALQLESRIPAGHPK